MNTFRLRKIAEKYARRLLESAGESEPQITEDLQKIASLNQIKIAGLKNKIKAADSLVRKLADGAMARAVAFNDFDAQTFENFLRQAAKNNNDALRYTLILSFENYSEMFEQILIKLNEANYMIDKIWNAWRLAGTLFDRGYRGINVTVISSQKQKFEIQFHTEESFQLKTATHDFYRELRSNKTTQERKDEIVGQMTRLAEKIFIPKEAKNL